MNRFRPWMPLLGACVLLAGCRARLEPIPAKALDLTPSAYPVTVVDYLRDPALCREAAEVGSPQAQYALATMYRTGRNVTRDDAKAATWYRRAAEQGHSLAQHNVGTILHEQGKLAEAVPWFERAAQQGITESQLLLIALYSGGAGLPENPEGAVKWLTVAARGGVARAQYELGRRCRTGRGTERDTDAALKWLQAAAAANKPEAHAELGTMYSRGDGVTADAEKAVAWYRSGLALGSAQACYNLGAAYMNGKGVKRDLVRGLAHIQAAAAADFQPAIAQFEKLKKMVSGKDRSAAAALAGTLLKKPADD